MHRTGPHLPPRVSVIIPARDAAPTLERTLQAVGAQRLAEPFEVIVVDDGSRDDTAAITRRHEPLVTLVSNQTSLGPGAARNRGVAAAAAPVLAFTDADCFPAPDWLASGLEALAHAELVQGRVAPDPSVRRTPFDRTLWVEDHFGFYQTANLFVRRETFDAVGGFRDWALERQDRRRWAADRRRGRAMRTPIGEDTLFAWRALRQGARSGFAEDAVVHHAVVPGGIRDEVADRWHWARDMPGLVRLVPELRRRPLYRRVFFNICSAQFDQVLAALALAALSRRRLWLFACAPYLRRVVQESASYELADAAAYVLGMPVVDAATCAALLLGSAEWRSLVL
jgi:glycosyltransferase involved in cell wall biosynthesis